MDLVLSIILITTTTILIGGIIMPLLIVMAIYENTFKGLGKGVHLFDATDFGNLIEKRVTFKSKRGRNKYAGFIYNNKDDVGDKGVIIVSHGIMTNHTAFFGEIDYFTSRGYTVFTYDATGCGETGGKTIRGLPQGIIDLRRAIRFVRKEPVLKKLPLLLYGHSWGAYSVMAVGNFCRGISGIVARSGFITATRSMGDLIVKNSSPVVGPIVCYIALYQMLKFKKYARASAMRGIKKSGAKVFVLHSKDDDIVLFSNYLKLAKVFRNNPNVKFKSYKNRQHFLQLEGDGPKRYKESEAAIFATRNFDRVKNRDMLQKMQNASLSIDMDYLLEVVDFFDSAIANSTTKAEKVEVI